MAMILLAPGLLQHQDGRKNDRSITRAAFCTEAGIVYLGDVQCEACAPSVCCSKDVAKPTATDKDSMEMYGGIHSCEGAPKLQTIPKLRFLLDIFFGGTCPHIPL